MDYCDSINTRVSEVGINIVSMDTLWIIVVLLILGWGLI